MARKGKSNILKKIVCTLTLAVILITGNSYTASAREYVGVRVHTLNGVTHSGHTYLVEIHDYAQPHRVLFYEMEQPGGEIFRYSRYEQNLNWFFVHKDTGAPTNNHNLIARKEKVNEDGSTTPTYTHPNFTKKIAGQNWVKYTNDYQDKLDKENKNTTPSQPSQPSTPKQPTQPTTPSTPKQPTTPTTPKQPTNPTQPTTPSQPTQPPVDLSKVFTKVDYKLPTEIILNHRTMNVKLTVETIKEAGTVNYSISKSKDTPGDTWEYLSTDGIVKIYGNPGQSEDVYIHLFSTVGEEVAREVIGPFNFAEHYEELYGQEEELPDEVEIPEKLHERFKLSFPEVGIGALGFAIIGLTSLAIYKNKSKE
ncbi:hypothetical protein HYG86_10140 [Alkalicella caledoniensis]|uniref:Uncharacterized protein n=1 Tax=Alkalicella caledoniensis TaxID=2731377 RepID=A0A7G9W8T3_ALKCA|nr:hypothetical protein [Alkalicella caledoniensis]QNO15095.1 hypothetical protein HYG86_10140 [Alkalicella caledoniensis]